MKKFLKLYEEENQEENVLTIDSFTETIEKLKEVFNNSEPIQTAGVLLLDIISKIVNDSDNQQDLIDEFQKQLEDALETAEQDNMETPEGEEGIIDFDDKFQEMNDMDDSFGEFGDESLDTETEIEDEAGYVIDDIEKSSKDEKLSNIKELLKPSEKSKPKSKKKSKKKDEEKETEEETDKDKE